MQIFMASNGSILLGMPRRILIFDKNTKFQLLRTLLLYLGTLYFSLSCNPILLEININNNVFKCHVVLCRVNSNKLLVFIYMYQIKTNINFN